jgi:hypothetical protein
VRSCAGFSCAGSSTIATLTKGCHKPGVTPLRDTEHMSVSNSSIDFAHAARTIGREVRRRGLVAPGFRCPPRIAGVDRSLRRVATGAVVAVQLKGRPWAAIVGDMIEGVIVTNQLQPPQSDRLRADLWIALGFEAPRLRRVA